MGGDAYGISGAGGLGGAWQILQTRGGRSMDLVGGGFKTV